MVPVPTPSGPAVDLLFSWDHTYSSNEYYNNKELTVHSLIVDVYNEYCRSKIAIVRNLLDNKYRLRILTKS